MKITKSKLKQLIQEELAKLYEQRSSKYALPPREDLKSPLSTFKKAAIRGGEDLRAAAKERAALTKQVQAPAETMRVKQRDMLRMANGEAPRDPALRKLGRKVQTRGLSGTGIRYIWKATDPELAKRVSAAKKNRLRTLEER